MTLQNQSKVKIYNKCNRQFGLRNVQVWKAFAKGALLGCLSFLCCSNACTFGMKCYVDMLQVPGVGHRSILNLGPVNSHLGMSFWGESDQLHCKVWAPREYMWLRTLAGEREWWFPKLIRYSVCYSSTKPHLKCDRLMFKPTIHCKCKFSVQAKTAYRMQFVTVYA